MRKFGIYEKAMPESLSISEKLASVKGAGYDSLELCFDESSHLLQRLDMPKLAVTKIKHEAQNSGISLDSISLSAHRRYSLGSSDAAMVHTGLELSKKAFEFACELGVQVILIAGYDVFYEESTPATFNRYLGNLQAITGIAASQGLILALENVDAAISSDIASCIRIIENVKMPNLRLYLDVGNMNAMGVDYLLEIPKAKGLIEAVHIKDSKPGVSREVPMGAGTVDFTAVAALLDAQGCAAPCVIEMWHLPGTDYSSRISKALKFVRQHFDRASMDCGGSGI